MKTRFMLSTAMTAAEQAAGRYLRAPDGHPEAGVVTVDVPEPPAAPPEQKTIEQQYDEEFGSVETDTSGEGDGDGGEAVEESTEEPPKPEGVPDAAKELDELKARNLQLERDLEEARRAPQPKETPKEELSNESTEVKAPDPKDYEFGAADEKFIADTASFHAEQRFNELQEAKQVEARIEAIETSWKGAIETDAVKEQYPDFDELVTKGADEKAWACSPTMAVLIKQSEVGPHVAYELASNAEESRRIAALEPHDQLLEFGRLEGRAMARAEFAATPTPTQKRVPSAPPPPVNRSRGNGGQYATAQDAMYDKMLNEF